MSEAAMSEAEVVALMGSSCTPEEWDANCDRVKAAFGGHYPAFWFPAVILSGLCRRVAARWGGTDEITVNCV